MTTEEVIPDNLIDWPSFNLGQKRMLEEGYMKKPSQEEIYNWSEEFVKQFNPDFRTALLLGINALWQHLGGETIINITK